MRRNDRDRRFRSIRTETHLLEQLRVGPEVNFAYLVGDRASGEAALVDPAYEVERLLTAASEAGLTVRYVINTHSHGDHAGGNAAVQERCDAVVLAHESAGLAEEGARGLADGEVVMLGETPMRFLHTPGHRFDSICILVADRWLFTGDTLFIGECGRADLPGSDVDQLWRSLLEVIGGLDEAIEVYPGHDYGMKPWSTVGEQRRDNYTLQKRTLEEFRRFMFEPESHVVFDLS